MSTSRFDSRSNADILRLIETQRLAWVVSAHATDARATLLPLLPVLDGAGNIEYLAGHFARSNDHTGYLRSHPRSLILFLGPNGYISPSWIQDKTWGPTWNYASVQFVVDIEFVDEPAFTDAHLRELVDTMEAGRADAWNVSMMGARYGSLSRHVIGFRARILATRAKFKLGQDERDAVFSDITLALNANGAHELLHWMKDFNSGRE